MPSTLATNAQNDLFIDASGSLVMLTGVDAIVAACTSACRTVLGECVLQTGIGLPNFQTVWVGVPDLAIWQSYLQTTLLNISGVTQVRSVALAVQNNVLNYIAEIETIYGTTALNGAI